jgi:hypothetical protein
MRNEPLRILGYIGSHFTNVSIPLERLRTKLGTNGNPVDAPPQATPWAPRTRIPVPHRPPPQPDSTVKTLKT